MTLYLEQCLETLEALPVELRRNLILMKDLDQRSADGVQKVEKLVAAYLKNGSTWQTDKRVKHIDSIKDLQEKCRACADDKVNVANQTYEMVDKHIRKLDDNLARFEGELKQKFLSAKAGAIDTTATSTNLKKKGTSKSRSKLSELKSSAESKRRRKGEYPGETPRVGQKKRKKLSQALDVPAASPILADPAALCQLSGPALIQTLAGASGDVLDMPIDVNEPTYCVCHQVSYGEMIGCDNENCGVEWFHFSCMGLTSKPKGAWYCPRCTEERKKK